MCPTCGTEHEVLDEVTDASAFILGQTPFDERAIRVFAERMTEAKSLRSADAREE